MTATKWVAYYQVATARQGASGLGLEAQRKSVSDHLRVCPNAEFIEVESGKQNDLPQLLQALARCRLHKATLIIAKLDRLARNVVFISNLMESGVEFVAVDFPQANRLTVHILAAVAEHEASMISARTKAALQAARARGVRLGTRHNGRIAPHAECGAKASALVRAAKAQKRRSDVLPVIETARVSGAHTLRALAAHLNDRGIPGPRSGRWYPNSVRRVVNWN